MKYEIPELTALTPAINAIQGSKPTLDEAIDTTSPHAVNESYGVYADWE
jgi:hypothetical protein